MISSNYHTHTLYCDGKDTPEELVKEAISLGMCEIGFSGHSYTWFDESYCMSLANTKKYKEDINALKDKYKDKIKIYLGIEQDYYSEEPTDDYDFVIGSVHYVKAFDKYLPIDESRDELIKAVKEYFDGDFYALAEEYYKCVADVVTKTKCDIIGHFDLVTKYNKDGLLFDENNIRYINAEDFALNTLLKSGKIFELNTGGVLRGHRTKPYLSERALNKIIEEGGKIVFSSDCHNKQYLLYGRELMDAINDENIIKALRSEK